MNGPNDFHLTISWLEEHFDGLKDFQPLTPGGQKLVFTAEHEQEGNVVLKVLQPHHDHEDLRREILAVQQVRSPRVPTIHAHGSVATPLGPAYWIREQRIVGRTLRELLIDGPLQANDVLQLAWDVLEALVKAEEASIVHRDVKPDNIIRDQDGHFWLLDFGIARHLSLDSRTATALPFGKLTWGYSPTEQCRNDKPAIDARADLFALGVTIYEAASGVNPFREGTLDPLEMLRRVENERLPALNLPIPGGGAFRDFVAALTQRRRDHRPESAREALAWLAEIRRVAGR